MDFLRRLLGRARPPADPLGPEPTLSPEEQAAELKAWSIITLDNPESGDPVILRLRERRPERCDLAAFRTAVSIRWTYDPPSPFPSPDVRKGMHDFETAIDRLTGLNGFSELVLVSTGRGEKEWMFYSSDKDLFMTTLNALLAGHEPFPLRIEFDHDPEWEKWRDIVESLRERGTVEKR